MLQMVKAIEDSLHQDIDAANWMSAETKQAGARQIGRANRQDRLSRPLARLFFGRNQTRRLCRQCFPRGDFENQRRFATFGKVRDAHEWNMTPPTVNAYEDSQTNTINFPAGILQPPFFDASAPDAVNYGAIGAVIGHEIIHGFDDQGRKFDARGNLRDWWTSEDATNYDERDQCIQAEYTEDIPEARA